MLECQATLQVVCRPDLGRGLNHLFLLAVLLESLSSCSYRTVQAKVRWLPFLRFSVILLERFAELPHILEPLPNGSLPPLSQLLKSLSNSSILFSKIQFRPVRSSSQILQSLSNRWLCSAVLLSSAPGPPTPVQSKFGPFSGSLQSVSSGSLLLLRFSSPFQTVRPF